MYDHYKPLRNFVRKLDMETCLVNIWQLLQNIDHCLALPQDFRRFDGKVLSEHIRPWELGILAREVILHAQGENNNSLLTADNLTAAINHIRRLVGEQSKKHVNENTIRHEMFRLSHQQFFWQESDQAKLARYLKIFKDENLDKILSAATSLTVKEIYVIGITIAGYFLEHTHVDLKINLNGYGITEEKLTLFLQLTAMDIIAIRTKTHGCQEYNENWGYTFNPLMSTPLVIIDPARPTRVICPIPRYLFERITEGLIFDIYRVNGHEQPFGSAFQAYVKNVSERLLLNSVYQVREGEPYQLNRQKKHGLDLYVFDDDDAMLIECKAKRLRLNSKYQGNEEALSVDLSTLAQSIFQNYKNLIDIINNSVPWKPNGRNLYPVVVTLMDCYLWTPAMQDKLNAFIIEKMIREDINLEVMGQYPYSVMSVADFELSLQVILHEGIQTFFNDKQHPYYSGWSVESFIRNKYRYLSEHFNVNYLKVELDELIDSFAFQENQP